MADQVGAEPPRDYPWPVEELAAAIAVFSHANVRGTRGGRALRESMSALLHPSELTTQTLERLGIEPYREDGTLRPLSDLIAQLEAANPPHADYWRIFGISAGSTLSQLVRYGADTLRNLSAQVGISDDAALLLADTRELVGEPSRYNPRKHTDADRKADAGHG
jgi:TP901 family phage tail tape measure protein